MQVPFLDLKGQHDRVRSEIDAALRDTIDRSAFIGGASVKELEAEIARRVGTKHAVGTSSCTAALTSTLRSLDLESGDEVIVPTLTAMPTAEAAANAGARAVFADVEEDQFQIDPADVERRITDRTRALVVVHLYGLGARIDALSELADKHDLVLVEDIAQAFGARSAGRPLGSIGRAGCISFFPSKPLGGFGDGGMVVTDDDAIARYVRMFTNHGRLEKFTHEILGANERLDALQSAVLNVKLKSFDDWNARRRQVADWYEEDLAGVEEIRVPRALHGVEPVWHLYVVRSAARDELRAFLKERGVGTGLHYPEPLHLQPAFAGLGYEAGSLPEAEKATSEVLSLPMDPFLTREQVSYVARSIQEFLVSMPVQRALS